MKVGLGSWSPDCLPPQQHACFPAPQESVLEGPRPPLVSEEATPQRLLRGVLKDAGSGVSDS